MSVERLQTRFVGYALRGRDGQASRPTRSFDQTSYPSLLCLPAERLPHLFRKFSRLEGEERGREIGGSGLGSRFTFTVPAVEEAVTLPSLPSRWRKTKTRERPLTVLANWHPDLISGSGLVGRPVCSTFTDNTISIAVSGARDRFLGEPSPTTHAPLHP